MDWARSLIDEFGSLAGVLAASPTAHLRVLEGVTAPVDFLQAVRSAMLHALRWELLDGPILTKQQAVLDYFRADLAHAPAEQVRVLFLDARNRLLRDELVSTGSIGEAPIYPREIMRRALEVGATALIIAHNHPSGYPAPSDADIEITRRVADAGRTLDIRLHDHVIVARTGWTSFRALGLL